MVYTKIFRQEWLPRHSVRNTDKNRLCLQRLESGSRRNSNRKCDLCSNVGEDKNNNGIDDNEETKYTVTYKDGVDGEVFADDVHGNLLSGVATPAFSGGTPTRTGYVFKGWNPAVAATVTGNATYVATWGEDKNNNGIDDNEETKYTVMYTDGVDGKEIFADQVYGNLLPGVDTPAFKGTPTREGYVFKGWNPEVAATVTGNATYIATWEKIKIIMVSQTMRRPNTPSDIRTE